MSRSPTIKERVRGRCFDIYRHCGSVACGGSGYAFLSRPFLPSAFEWWVLMLLKCSIYTRVE